MTLVGAVAPGPLTGKLQNVKIFDARRSAYAKMRSSTGEAGPLCLSVHRKMLE